MGESEVISGCHRRGVWYSTTGWDKMEKGNWQKGYFSKTWGEIKAGKRP